MSVTNGDELFTCPKCGGHWWGTIFGSVSQKTGEAQGYCSYPGCGFMWKRIDDDKYFVPNKTAQFPDKLDTSTAAVEKRMEAWAYLETLEPTYIAELIRSICQERDAALKKADENARLLGAANLALKAIERERMSELCQVCGFPLKDHFSPCLPRSNQPDTPTYVTIAWKKMGKMIKLGADDFSAYFCPQEIVFKMDGRDEVLAAISMLEDVVKKLRVLAGGE